MARLDRFVALADGAASQPEDSPGDWLDFAWQAREYEVGVRYAKRLLDESTGYSLLASAARFAAKTGDRDQTLRWLESALEKLPDGERGTRRAEAWVEDPAFAPLQSLVGLEPGEREAWTKLWARLVERANE